MSKDIYKHLLDILKVESNLDSDNDWTASNEILQALSTSIVKLRQAAAAATTSIHDKKSIFPKVVKTSARILSKFVSLATSQVSNDKLVCAVLDTLNTMFAAFAERDQVSKAEIQSYLTEDQAGVVMLYLQLLTIFESQAADKQGDRLQNELLLETSLLLFHNLLSCLFNITTDAPVHVDKKLWSHKLYTSFEGPLASQTVLSLLACMQHKSKRIAGSAAADLLLSLQCFPNHREVWRACYPGTFSGLFVLTQSGFKSGSALLFTALGCLLQITQVIAQDSAPENAQLLQYLQSARHPCTSAITTAVGTAHTSSKDLFTSMLTKASNSTKESQAAARGLPVVATNIEVRATDRSLVDGFRTVQEYLQWRVQLLQRIQLPLAVAYREVFKECGPKQRCQLVRKLAYLLCNCHHMLGGLCTAKCVAVLLSGTVDAHPDVRAATAEAWRTVQTALKCTPNTAPSSTTGTTSDAYMKVTDSLSKKFTDVLQSLRASAEVGNEPKLRDQLRAVLGIGHGIKEHIVSVMRAAGTHKEVLRSVSVLFQPDVGACGARVTASVLEKRQYAYFVESSAAFTGTGGTQLGSPPAVRVTVVEGGYYRVPWQHLQDSDGKDLAERAALFIGKHGLLEGIIELAKKAFHGLQNHDRTHISSSKGHTAASEQGRSETAVAAAVMSQAIGSLRLLNTAMLGLASVRVHSPSGSPENLRADAVPTKVSDEGIAAEDKKCKRCGKSGTQMLRCSRCKMVYYCSKQHQAADWTEHKVGCKANRGTVDSIATTPTTTSAPIAATTSASTTTISTVEADLESPSSLLSTTGISILLDGNNVHSSNAVSSGATGSQANSVYSAAKKQYFIQLSTQLCMSIIENYLELRHSVMHNTSAGGSGGESVSSRYALFAVTATEGLANIAYSAGPFAFNRWLMECLYPLLELLVDANPLVKQAAQCTLSRIALYVHSATLPSLIRRNLDYIVDKICLQMRIPTRKNHDTTATVSIISSALSTSTHLIVDFVFSILDTQISDISDTIDAGSDGLAPLFLLRDVICDALENIDAFSVSTRYHGAQLQALLRVLRVLASRAAPTPTEPTFLTQKRKSPASIGAGDNCNDQLRISPFMRDRLFTKDHRSHKSIPSKTATTPSVQRKSSPTSDARVPGDQVDAPQQNIPLQEAPAAAQSLLDFTRNLFTLQHTETVQLDADGSAEEGLLGASSHATLEGTEGEDEDERYTTVPPPPAVQLLLDVIHRCCTFLALPNPASQLLVIETMCCAFVRLSLPEHTTHLLPCVHTTWPVVVNRIRELRQILTASPSTVAGSAVAKGVRKVTSGSSALLSLENSQQGSTLTSALTAISTAAKPSAHNSTAYTALTWTGHNSTSPSPAPQAVSQESQQQRARLHILPALLDLVSILTVSSAGFMTTKLKQDFLPEAFALLCWFQREYVADVHGSKFSGNSLTVSTETKPLKTMSRAQLLMLAPSDKTVDTEATPTSTPNPHSAPSGSADCIAIGNSKHSLHSQVKVSLLSALLQLCEGGVELQRLMQVQVGPLVYLLLPLLSGKECDEVRQIALSVVRSLRTLDPSCADALLTCVLNSANTDRGAHKADGVVQREQALAMWTALQNAPSVTAATKSFTAVSAGEHLLTQYHRDKVLMQCVQDLVRHSTDTTMGIALGGSGSQHSGSSGVVNVNWLNRLALWSVV